MRKLLDSPCTLAIRKLLFGMATLLNLVSPNARFQHSVEPFDDTRLGHLVVCR